MDIAQLTVLDVVLEYPRWGGKRIRDYLLKNNIVSLTVKKAIKMKRIAKKYIKKHNLLPKVKRYEFAKVNDCWCMDFKYIKTSSGLRYLFAVIDDRSRKILGWILAKHANTKVAINLLKQIFNKYGKPKTIKTDRGTQFKSKFTKYLVNRKIFHIKSIPYYPRCNAKIERIFRDVEANICKIYGKFTVFEFIFLLE